MKFKEYLTEMKYDSVNIFYIEHTGYVITRTSISPKILLMINSDTIRNLYSGKREKVFSEVEDNETTLNVYVENNALCIETSRGDFKIAINQKQFINIRAGRPLRTSIFEK